MTKIAIIGGTGVYDPNIIDNIKEEEIMSPYGLTKYIHGTYKDKEVVFMSRHGLDHSIPPHLINYRANIWSLKKIGVTHIIATTAVGSLNLDFEPGHLVLIDQFLDFTKNRISTFYEGGQRGVAHVDMTNPYCPDLRHRLEKVALNRNIPIHNGGVYVCTEGPRFETPAEIKMFHMLGGDVVGMTNVPEVTLAAEAEICYATISVISNYAAGISKNLLTHTEVLEIMKENSEKLKGLILDTIDGLDKDSKIDCHCTSLMAGYGHFKL